MTEIIPVTQSNNVQVIEVNPSTPSEAVSEETTPVEANETEESVKESVPVPETKPDKFANKFALLSKREREIFKKEQSIKERTAQVEAYQKATETAKKNPLEYLKAAGVSMEDVVRHALTDGNEPTKEELTNKRLDEVTQKLADYEKREQEKVHAEQAAQQQAQINQVLSNINEVIDKNPDQYELIRSYNKSEEVFDVMFRVHSESNGKVRLSYEQAADLVEEQLLEEVTKEAERLSKLKKLNKKVQEERLNPPKPQVSTQPERYASKASTPVKTLTNKISTITPEKSSGNIYLSREESLAKVAEELKRRQSK